MNSTVVLSDDQLNEMATEVVRVMFGDGLVMEFACRAVILKRFVGLHGDNEDIIIRQLIQRVKTISDHKPEIVDHVDHHVRSADHSPTSFVAHASEAYELAEERNFANFN